MAVAALIISILALAAAGAGSWFTFRQSQAASQILSIEADRRHEERAPQLEARVEDVSGWHRMWLALRSADELAYVSCEIIEARGVEYGRSQNGVNPAAPSPVMVATWDQPLRQGDSACWRVLLGEDHSSEFRLRVSCRGEHGEWWTVTVPVTAPRTAPMTGDQA